VDVGVVCCVQVDRLIDWLSGFEQITTTTSLITYT